jgi:hypothetical protein
LKNNKDLMCYEIRSPARLPIALSKAVGIALLDRQVNSHEDKALTALLEAMKA